MKVRTLAVLFLSVFVFTLTTVAQVSINGSLRGRVNDPGNAAIAGAKLTLTNTATATTQTATSDGSGDYQFARVAPGVYTLTIEKDGFKRAQRESIVIAVNENAIADVALAVGAVSETVTIEGGTTTVQSQSVELSGLVSERRVKELPLNGRNFQKLVLLAPGVGGISGSTTNNPAISGARPVHNTYTIDGMGSNDERLTVGFAGLSNDSGTDLGESVPNIISTEAIQEFRIITTNADATFGRSSGGQINIVTKSGSNDWHGSAYEYLRNGALDARDFFNNTGPFLDSQGRAKTPPFKQNLLGATFGGRLVPDRHFFFGNYEGLLQRRREQSAVTTAVPNADLIRFVPGDLGKYLKTYFIDRGIIPASGNAAGIFAPLPAADRAAALNAGFAAAFFDGNATNGEAGTVQINNAPPRNIDQHNFLIRTDHKLTEALQVSARYAFAQSRDTTSREVFGNVPTLINQGASAATGFQGGGTQFAPRSLNVDWGRSEFDVRHNLTFSHLLELPFGKGRRLLGDANGFVNAVIGGWSLTGLAIIRSGEPFNVTRGIDYNDDGDTGADRPQLISGKLNDLYARGSLGRTQFLLPQTEALTRLNTPTQVTDLSLPIQRNAFRAARIAAYDLSLIKQFHLTETLRLGFEANAFNLFNRVNFSAPTANLSSALFGRITSTRAGTNPRQIQFGLKLSF